MGRRVLAAALAAVWVVTAVAACGGGGAAKTDSTAKEEGEAKREKLPDGPPIAWDQMTFEQRAQYMKEHVVPTMKPIFEAYDADFFADFGCATCHGDDMKERGFKMPNPDILTLYPSGTPEQKKLVETEREWLVFMYNRVVPNMRALLGLPKWNNDTQTGFSCFYCHPKGVSGDGGADAADAVGAMPGAELLADRASVELDAAGQAAVGAWVSRD